MELKYGFMIYVSLLLCIVFLAAYFKRKTGKIEYDKGKKLALINLLEDDIYYKKQKRIYKITTAIVISTMIVSVILAGLLLARPYKSKTITEERYSRDIILCIDISTSVDYLNKQVIKELIDVVDSMKTERFGIVIFNTSPVLVSPLTDDYAYTISQLNAIKQALDNRLNIGKAFTKLPEDYLYYDEFISGGTLVGNEERGSSLIGDGLASSIYQFSKKDTDRTKVVIFTTDNDLQGQPFVTLPKAAKLCSDNDIVVYGVGTKEMTDKNLNEMKQAMEDTGGCFYLEEESGSFNKIVDDIEKKSVALTQGKQYVIDTEYPEKFFEWMVFSIILMYVAMRIIKR